MELRAWISSGYYVFLKALICSNMRAHFKLGQVILCNSTKNDTAAYIYLKAVMKCDWLIIRIHLENSYFQSEHCHFFVVIW